MTEIQHDDDLDAAVESVESAASEGNETATVDDRESVLADSVVGLPEGLEANLWMCTDGIERADGTSMQSVDDLEPKQINEVKAQMGGYSKNANLVAFRSKEPTSAGKVFVGPETKACVKALHDAGYTTDRTKGCEPIAVPFSVYADGNAPKHPALAAKLDGIREHGECAREDERVAKIHEELLNGTETTDATTAKNADIRGEKVEGLPEALNPALWIRADGVQEQGDTDPGEEPNGRTIPSIYEMEGSQLELAKNEIGKFASNGGLIAFRSKEPGSLGVLFVGPSTRGAKSKLRSLGYRNADSSKVGGTVNVPFSVNAIGYQPGDPATAAKLENIRDYGDAKLERRRKIDIRKDLRSHVDQTL